MADELSPSEIEDVREVIRHCSLSRVEFYEVSARRYESASTADGDGRLSVGVQQRIDETSFGVRLTAHVVVAGGEATASVAGEYELLEGFRPSAKALRNFANEVAVMAVYPYLREAIASVTLKVLGAPVHLPIVQRGVISVADDDE